MLLYVMCIFSGGITRVANTKILTGIVYPSELQMRKINGIVKGVKVPKYQSPLQLVVYSNRVGIADSTQLEQATIEADSNNIIPVDPPAMILPFPLKSGTNRVKLLNFSQYPKLFEDLDLLFPQDTRTNAMNTLYDSIEEALPIQYIGSYKATIIPRWDKFYLLQAQQFRLSPDTQELLGTYYHRGFGFIVCQLINNNQQYHPFAYVHELREDHRLFIPTRHYHRQAFVNSFSKYYDPPETNDIQENIMRTLTVDDRLLDITSMRVRSHAPPADRQKYKPPTIGPDWDHEIYILNFPRIQHNGLLINKAGIRIIPANATRLKNIYTYIDSTLIPKEIAIGKIKYLFKIKIDPVYQHNHDLLI